MATLRSTTTVAPTGNINPNADPPTIAAPAGLATGDLLVVAVFYAQALAASHTVVVPSGMTRVSNQGSSPARLGAVYAAVVDNPATFTGGIALGSNVTSTRVAAVAVAFEPDVDHTFALGDVAYDGPEWNGSAMASDTYPTGATGDMVLGIAMTNKGASATLSEHTAVGGGTIVAQARALSAASGSVSDSTTSISVGGTGVSFNINQANGIMFSVGVSEVEGDDPEPELPEVTGHGLTSVQQMLETPGATFAHRNLGLTYPEMTEYGVRMAANAGFGVIEISCQRSSDGVWFGAHDQTPDRIANEATFDGQPFASLTWAQISTLTIGVGSSGAPRPFATLTELVETLPEDFVFMIDPKQQAATYMSEFLDLVDTLLGPERAFIKIDGAATPGGFQAAQARGYKTAAYYYAAPATPTPPTSLANNIAYVDIPGLNYDATQQGWDDLLNYGKPIWGHVCPTQSAVNEAMGKGATFTQCTSASIAPVGVESWVPIADGGSVVGVDVSPAGSGAKVGAGGGASSITLTAAGDGHKLASGGSIATIGTTTTGGGQKRLTGASTATITTTPSGVGIKVGTGGSIATIGAAAVGEGHRVESGQGGSSATIVLTSHGEGHALRTGGAVASIGINAVGAGQRVESGSGGSAVGVGVQAVGQGRAIRTGGSLVVLEVAAVGAGRDPDGGRDITVRLGPIHPARTLQLSPPRPARTLSLGPPRRTP